MELKEEQVNLRILKASEGKIIQNKTNSEIIGKIIYLGKEDSPENYIEIEEIIENLE